MASLEGTRTVLQSHDFARGELDSTTPHIVALHGDAASSKQDDPPLLCIASGGDGPSGVELCPSCGAPLGQPRLVCLPAGTRTTFPLGPNGGILVMRRVPGSNEWIEIEYFPPDDEHDDFRPVELLLPLKVAAVQLGLTVKTLYARASRMASSEKHGNRWFFKRDLLLSVDAAGERPVSSRGHVLRARARRRAEGEVLRAGSHVPGCLRRHEGVCAVGTRRRPSAAERAATTRSILDELGK